MAEEESDLPSSSSSSPPSKSVDIASRPTIILPRRTSMESLFTGGPGLGFGFSPGPMTLVSNFFSDNDDCKSFSQLLAGAMVSADAVPPGLSPKDLGLPDSPGFGLVSPGRGPFGMMHQQALAQVTAQAAQANPHILNQAEYSSSSSAAPDTSSIQLSVLSANTNTDQKVPSILLDSRTWMKESLDLSQSEQKSQPSSYSVDKPASDGYNWRKYGQKHVKGSEFPRSYYKCTHQNCPVKKKVERSFEGQVTEIIYKGQHNHAPPQTNKRTKDTANLNGISSIETNPNLSSHVQNGHLNKLNDGIAAYPNAKKDRESSQITPEHLSGMSDSEDVGDTENGVHDKDEDEPDAKRWNTEPRVSEPTSSHRTVTEPRIIVQATSEVDLLDDGFRWRKYGQKVVKGNSYPRSYYKCTTPECNVRKHIERASTDPKAVITTYEGKHNHIVPASRSSHNTGNSNTSQLKPTNSLTEKHALTKKTDLRNDDQRPITRLRLKDEQVT